MIIAVLALAFSLSGPDVANGEGFCVTPSDGFPFGSFGRQDTWQWRWDQCIREHREKLDREAERLRRQRLSERPASRLRDIATEQRRLEAEYRRWTDCATYGTCPSTVQDIREQLERNGR